MSEQRVHMLDLKSPSPIGIPLDLVPYAVCGVKLDQRVRYTRDQQSVTCPDCLKAVHQATEPIPTEKFSLLSHGDLVDVADRLGYALDDVDAVHQMLGEGRDPAVDALLKELDALYTYYRDRQALEARRLGMPAKPPEE